MGHGKDKDKVKSRDPKIRDDVGKEKPHHPSYLFSGKRILHTIAATLAAWVGDEISGIALEGR
jgi:hypothetical protein